MDSNYDRRLRISEAKRVRLGLMKIVENATRESQQLDAMRQGLFNTLSVLIVNIYEKFE